MFPAPSAAGAVAAAFWPLWRPREARVVTVRNKKAMQLGEQAAEGGQG